MQGFFLRLFLWATIFFANISYALPFNKLVFFGDSLTDNGNLYKVFLKKNA